MPTLPVYRGELQDRSLGVRLESWSPEAKPLIGEVGELVITEPMPSMPLFFWGDADGSRYRESYSTIRSAFLDETELPTPVTNRVEETTARSAGVHGAGPEAAAGTRAFDLAVSVR